MLKGKRINIRPIKQIDLKKIYQWSVNNQNSYFLLEGIGECAEQVY